jgi:hypothetical protein
MFLLNLGLGEFVALFGMLSGVVVALYLLDRSRRRILAPTLRFWRQAEHPPDIKHRRRIQQPVSLLMQLLGILFLLLAIAQLRLGAPDRASRDHILILDTSAWMSARGRQGSLMDEARSLARAWVASLPSLDRVMVVRADAVAAPATPFENNRQAVEKAILQSVPGAAALNLEQAFDFAGQVRKLHARRAGEVVYVGAGRITEEQTADLPAPPPGLRILPVAAPVENCGLRKISLRRSPSDPGLWETFVSVRNYGLRPRTLPLSIYFGSAPMGSTRLTLPPGGEQNARFEFRTRAAGWLEVRLQSQDSLAGDDRALLELPEEKSVDVLVYSREPNSLRPLMGTNPWVHATFRSPQELDPKRIAAARIVVFDRVAPPEPPATNAIWIEPPPSASPIRITGEAGAAQLGAWKNDHPVARGLHTRDLKLERSAVFARSANAVVIAQTAAGPALVAIEARHKAVVFGFHPGKTALRLELTTPLLFANIVQWMAPDAVRRRELTGASVGAVSVTLDSPADPALVRVLGDDGRSLPFTLDGRNLRFFGGAPGIVRVIAGGQELVYSLSLPDVAGAKWEFPSQARRGIPGRMTLESSARDLWHWLAVLGGLCLLLEWLLYGRARAVLTLRRASIHAFWPPARLFRKAS